MAIAQPDFVAFEYGQDGTWTVALSPPEDVTGWTVTCIVRNQNGGAALITKTIGAGITVTSLGTGVFVVAFAAADLTLTYGPGAYTIQLHRDNPGFTYPITDPAPLLIRGADSTDYPTLTNLGEYMAHRKGSMTINDNDAQQVLQLLFAAEDLLQHLCQRKFSYSTTLTEYYDGNGKREFKLLRRPVSAITSLYLDVGGAGGTAPSSFDPVTTLKTAGVDYYLVIDSKYGDGLSYSGKVRKLGGQSIWPNEAWRPQFMLGSTVRPCPGCIKVTYQAGYRLIPYRIKLAVWQMATILGQMAIDGRLAQSESAEGHSVSFLGYAEQAMMITSVESIVSGSRELVWA